MPVLSVITNGDNCWPDLKDKRFVVGNWVGIARLPNGTVQGNATVTVRIELPDGQTVLAETLHMDRLTLIARATNNDDMVVVLTNESRTDLPRACRLAIDHQLRTVSGEANASQVETAGHP